MTAASRRSVLASRPVALAIAHLARVDDRDEDTGCAQGDGCPLLQGAARLQHRQARAGRLLQPGAQRRDAGLVIGEDEHLGLRSDMDVQPCLRDIDTDIPLNPGHAPSPALPVRARCAAPATVRA